MDSSKGLFMNSLLIDESYNHKWKSHYSYPKIKGLVAEICNDETNSCLSTNQTGQVFLRKNDGDLWFVNFDNEFSAIVNVKTKKCLESDLNGSILTKTCENNNLGQQWNLVTIEETCIV